MKLSHKNETLEAIRGLASLYVAIGHLVLSYPNSTNFVKLLFSFGQEAVITFFIISGYVIHYSWEKRNNDSLFIYFKKRFRRIYFPFVIAIVLSVIITNEKISWKELVGNLLMLQDFNTAKPGVFVNTFMGNAPLWSLSYEWGFYLIFPFIYLTIKEMRNRNFIISMISFFCMLSYILFPNHILLVPAYLLIWWSGLELSSIGLKGGKIQLKDIKSVLFAYLPILTLLVITCYFYYSKGILGSVGIYPILFLRHFSFAVLFVYLTSINSKLKLMIRTLISPFKQLAPISYSIYIFHYIILVQLQINLPIYYELPIKVAALLALSYLTEIKLQKYINKRLIKV
nr:acyltransferase [uncultured Pedobacter sp.]